MIEEYKEQIDELHDRTGGHHSRLEDHHVRISRIEEFLESFQDQLGVAIKVGKFSTRVMIGLVTFITVLISAIIKYFVLPPLVSMNENIATISRNTLSIEAQRQESSRLSAAIIGLDKAVDDLNRDSSRSREAMLTILGEMNTKIAVVEERVNNKDD